MGFMLSIEVKHVQIIHQEGSARYNCVHFIKKPNQCNTSKVVKQVFYILVALQAADQNSTPLQKPAIFNLVKANTATFFNNFFYNSTYRLYQILPYNSASIPPTKTQYYNLVFYKLLLYTTLCNRSCLLFLWPLGYFTAHVLTVCQHI